MRIRVGNTDSESMLAIVVDNLGILLPHAPHLSLTSSLHRAKVARTQVAKAKKRKAKAKAKANGGEKQFTRPKSVIAQLAAPLALLAPLLRRACR